MRLRARPNARPTAESLSRLQEGMAPRLRPDEVNVFSYTSPAGDVTLNIPSLKVHVDEILRADAPKGLEKLPVDEVITRKRLEKGIDARRKKQALLKEQMFGLAGGDTSFFEPIRIPNPSNPKDPTLVGTTVPQRLTIAKRAGPTVCLGAMIGNDPTEPYVGMWFRNHCWGFKANGRRQALGLNLPRIPGIEYLDEVVSYDNGTPSPSRKDIEDAIALAGSYFQQATNQAKAAASQPNNPWISLNTELQKINWELEQLRHADAYLQFRREVGSSRPGRTVQPLSTRFHTASTRQDVTAELDQIAATYGGAAKDLLELYKTRYGTERGRMEEQAREIEVELLAYGPLFQQMLQAIDREVQSLPVHQRERKRQSLLAQASRLSLDQWDALKDILSRYPTTTLDQEFQAQQMRFQQTPELQRMSEMQALTFPGKRARRHQLWRKFQDLWDSRILPKLPGEWTSMDPNAFGNDGFPEEFTDEFAEAIRANDFESLTFTDDMADILMTALEDEDLVEKPWTRASQKEKLISMKDLDTLLNLMMELARADRELYTLSRRTLPVTLRSPGRKGGPRAAYAMELYMDVPAEEKAAEYEAIERRLSKKNPSLEAIMSYVQQVVR